MAAVAGRREVLSLCSRETGRVKFEGGTYSAHELSLVASHTLVRHLVEHEKQIYPALAEKGRRMQAGLTQAAADAGVHVCTTGPPTEIQEHGSLVMLHVLREGAAVPECPEDLAETSHPFIDERLLKSSLMLEDVSVRSGLGAISTAHDEEHLEQTLEGFRAVFRRVRRAGLV